MIPAGANQAAGSEANAESGQPASITRRLFALVYEVLLLSALLLVAGFAVLPLVGPPPPPGGEYSSAQLYLLPVASSAFLFLYYVAITGIYCVGFWVGGRRTLAMKTWGLALVTDSGDVLDARHAIKRYLTGWIGPCAGLAGFFALGRWGTAAGLVNFAWVWLDRDRKFLHDRLAGTRVVRNLAGG